MPPGVARAPAPPPGAAAYCTAARRIRHRHARRPERLHQELCDLSKRHDAERSALPPEAKPQAAGLEGGPCEAFAGEVARRLEGPVLRQSQRRALLAAARRAGIGRFEANLMIAAVQHARGSDAKAIAPAPGRATTGGIGAFAIVTLVALVQTAIVCGAWLVLRG